MSTNVNATDKVEAFIDCKEVARILGYSVPTIRKWVEHRKIPFYKIKNLVKFKASEVVAFMEKHRVEPIKG